jgi:hypothetical protein
VDASQTATLTAALADPALSAEVTITINPVGTDVDTTPPAVSLSSSSSEVTAPGAITLSASASDDVGVTKVVFFEGATRLGEDDSAPYTFERRFGAADNGSYSYTATAFDAAGNSGSSDPVTVTVSPGEPSDDPPVVIPTTTKVADSATRDALSAFDPDSGTMRFTENTLRLQNLHPDDVLVSEPSEAAPYGYLRKVKAIRREGTGVVLETVQASLNEAVRRGGFDGDGDLGPGDVLVATPSLPGVTLRTLPAAATDALQSTDVRGDGYDFEVAIDVVIDGNVEGSGATGKGKVRVQGLLRFNAGYDIGVGIELCAEIPPACVDRFEARMGIEQYSNLKVTGKFDGRLEREVKLATYHFRPIVFFIGPVPVVLVPVIDAMVGANGEAKLNFSFAAELSAQLLLGAKWTDPDDGGRGWEDLSRKNGVQPRVIDQTFDASMRLRAYGKADAKLLLYGVAGPGFASRGGAGADVQFSRKPLWTIFGYIGASITFQVDLGGLLKLSEHSETVLDEEFTLLEASNQPPRFSNVKTDTIQVSIGVPTLLGPRAGFSGYFDVMDPEGDPLTLTVTSNKDGAIPLNVTFQTAGPRTVTVTAKDSAGATSSISLSINVINSLPILSISVASNSVPATVQYVVTATAYDPETDFLECDRLSWSVEEPDVVTPQASKGTCAAIAVFAQEGTRTLSVTATDPHGGSSSETLSVTVTSPPENGPPVIDPSSFSVRAYRGPRDPYSCGTGYYCEVPNGGVLYNGQVGDYYPPLYLSLSASDPEGDPLTVQWFCKTGTQQALVTDEGDGTYSCEPLYSPSDPIKVWAVVSDGVTSVDSEVRTFVMLQRVN